MSVSSGDLFPYYFRRAGLGKLIGTRTWGGVIGTEHVPTLIDGGYVHVPTSAHYTDAEGWFIEGRGVEPDIAVPDDPARSGAGGDAPIDAAIQYLLRELERHPPARPVLPRQAAQFPLDYQPRVVLREGHFDQNRMLALIEEVLNRGKAEGYPLTRLVANMEWALEDRPGVNDVVEYETRLNYVLPKYDDAVC